MKTYILTAFAFCFLFGCSDSSSTTPEPAFPIGKWQWIATEGGIGGVHITPASAGFSCLVNFQSQTHAALYRNDTLVASGNFSLTTADSVVYNLKLRSGFSQSILVDRLPNIILFDTTDGVVMKLRHDTLTTEQVNITDGFTSVFVKQK